MKRVTAAITIGLVFSFAGCSSSPSTIPSDKYVVDPAEHPMAVSVIRIDATSKKCGRLNHGTGFAVAGGFIVSNAHVVAAATDISAANPSGSIKFKPKLAYFDPIHDLAILHYSGAQLPNLQIGKPLKDNELVTAYGYTAGKQLRAEESLKIRSFKWQASDIFGSPAGLQSIYKLKAHIGVGDSGGPLLDAHGNVRGVVFGKSSTEAEVAYAMGPEVILAALDKANTGASFENDRCLPKD